MDLIIEAAMEGSRHQAVQAFLNDPHCTDMNAGAGRAAADRYHGDMAELEYSAMFRPCDEGVRHNPVTESGISRIAQFSPLVIIAASGSVSSERGIPPAMRFQAGNE